VNERRCVGKIGTLVVGMLVLGAVEGAAAPPMPYPTILTPGTPAEQAALLKSSGATLQGEVRHAEAGQFWVYGFPVAANAHCRIELALDADAHSSAPNVTVLGLDNKPLPMRVEIEPDGTFSVVWTVPDKWPLGARQSIVISAKGVPLNVRRVRFSMQEPDTDGDGLPDTIRQLLMQGLPATARPTVFRSPSRPYTTTQTPRLPDPSLDLQTDALFAYTTDATVIASWKARGYTVWAMGGSRDGKAYAEKHPEELQTDAGGRPIAIGESYYLTPTANRSAIERAYYTTALTNGSEGVCPEEPEYFARAGYEAAFKQAWQQQYHAPWQDPAGSVTARWKAGQLMAALETAHISDVLQSAALTRPGARRMVALHSPLSYAQWGIVSPQYRITNLSAVQEVVGQVWTGTARTPARYAGVRRDRTFSVAYLEYSSLYQLLRGTGKRLWFLMDPLEDNPDLPLADYKAHYEQTLIAALLFPGVDAYEVMPWPERVYGHVPSDYAIEIDAAAAALQDMHNQSGESGNAAADATIGVLISDSMQWQRENPNASDFDGVFGLTLPLLQRGVPVQMVSLDRVGDLNYLKPFKTLLLSYDFQKPLDSHVQAALIDWVRRGGSLLFFGGSDPYNAVADAWWRQARRETPQDDLWTQASIPVGGSPITRSAAPEDTRRYQTILKAGGQEHTLANRRAYALDLTPYAQKTGSVAVRFSDVTPQDGWGAWLASAELRVGGRLAAAFPTGTDIESRFLVYDHNSQFTGEARFADGNASWTYQFDNLPRNTPVTLTLDMGNGFSVAAASVTPDFGHTLLSTGEVGALARAFPRLRIGAAYPATVYPQLSIPTASSSGQAVDPATLSRPLQASIGRSDRDQKAPKASETPTILYTLRAGGTPIWMQSVGRGLILNVGVAPGFFSASERSSGLLRALVQYAHQRAGGAYREPGVLRLQRGRYTIVRSLGESEDVEGRTIDLLSPSLNVADDRTIPPRSLALLYDLGPNEAAPHLGFVAGRLLAKVEMPTATGFFTRGPQGTTGVARLHAGGKRLAGARAMDHLGRSIDLQAFPDGNTLLLRYPNDPDGVVVRVGWK
jgi:hypothetical protein